MTLPPWMVGQLSFKEAQVGGGAEDVAHLSAATIVMVLAALLFAVILTRFDRRSAAIGLARGSKESPRGEGNHAGQCVS